VLVSPIPEGGGVDDKEKAEGKMRWSRDKENMAKYVAAYGLAEGWKFIIQQGLKIVSRVCLEGEKQPTRLKKRKGAGEQSTTY